MDGRELCFRSKMAAICILHWRLQEVRYTCLVRLLHVVDVAQFLGVEAKSRDARVHSMKFRRIGLSEFSVLCLCKPHKLSMASEVWTDWQRANSA